MWYLRLYTIFARFFPRAAVQVTFFLLQVGLPSFEIAAPMQFNCPRLGRVPGINHDLTIKATVNGVVYLKQNRLKKRYTGSKYSAVDINGKLWLKASDLQRHLRNEKTPPKSRVKNCQVAPPGQGQNYDNLLTPADNLPTAKAKLSTKRTYFIHKREVRARILGYLNTMRGKKELYFWTVTFPQGTQDPVAYKIFNVWLTALRQYKLLKQYLWIAERQKNGTVHYHIAVPHKMPAKRVNAMMRGTLTTYARRGLLPCNAYAIRRYNGVDLAKNRKTKRVTNFAIKKGSRALVTYLTKYVTKNDGGFSNLAWHNSRGYSAIFTGLAFTVDEFKNNGFHLLLKREARFDTEFFTFIPWFAEPPDRLVSHLFELNSYIQSLLN